MKFVTAHQSVEEFVSEMENLIQSGAFHADNLLAITLKEHATELKSLVPVEIETVDEKDFKDSDPLNNHGLDEHSVELYDDILRRGGYVLLDKENGRENKKKATDEKENIELSAPGFGVDLKAPQSDETNHEDNFNPNDPNPETKK